MTGLKKALSLFFKRYADFSGRSTRSEFWWVQLVLIIVVVMMGFLIFYFNDSVPLVYGPRPEGVAVSVLAGLMGLAIFVPAIALSVRRFHDRNLSGWWYLGLGLFQIIPFLGLVATIWIFVITVSPTKAETNKWGPPPSIVV